MPAPARDATYKVNDRFESIELDHVEVGGEIGRRIDITIRNNMLAVDVDGDFLQPFLDPQASGGYIGLGKFVDALTRLCAYSHDKDLLGLKKHVIDQIVRTQEADGYFGMMHPDHRVWKLWDVHETAYLIYGLSVDYELTGAGASLAAAQKMAGHVMPTMLAEPDRLIEDGGSIFHVATLGIDKAMINLWRLTGDGQYLDFCVRRLGMADWDYPIVEGRWGDVQGHAYAYLARCLAQLWYYRITGDRLLLASTRRAIDFLLRSDGLLISGSCGMSECWHSNQDGAGNPQESCTAAYVLMVLDDLLRLEGDSLYGDIMEREIHNALFAAQSPDGRRIRYFTPLEGRRHYFPNDTYCCPNNFRRTIARLPQCIYYRATGGVLVNLYAPSSATIELPDGVTVTLRQETDYPNSGRVMLHVEPSRSAEFAVQLRIPRWCKEANVTVNGEPVSETITPGTFATIQRHWSTGDRVAIELPMPWRLIRGRQAQAGRAAIMRGPMLYCLSRTTNMNMANTDVNAMRQLTLDASSLGGPVSDKRVRSDGLACTLKAWRGGAWYATDDPAIDVRATEFADPDGEMTYFALLNPNDERLVDDELIKP